MKRALEIIGTIAYRRDMNKIMRALMHTGHGPRAAWLMGRASYIYSRGHGLSRWEAFVGALECAVSSVRGAG